MAVDAARADLPHQVHAHGIAAEREEGAVPEREDAAEAPDQIDRQCEEGKAEIFPDQRHEIVGQMERRGRRHDEIEDGHKDGRGQNQRKEDRRCVRSKTLRVMLPPPFP